MNEKEAGDKVKEVFVELVAKTLSNKDSIFVQHEIDRIVEGKEYQEFYQQVVEMFIRKSNLEVLMLLTTVLAEMAGEGELSKRTVTTLLLSTVWRKESLEVGAISAKKLEEAEESMKLWEGLRENGGIH